MARTQTICVTAPPRAARTDETPDRLGTPATERAPANRNLSTSVDRGLSVNYS